jgi:hypothetical protein
MSTNYDLYQQDLARWGRYSACAVHYTQGAKRPRTRYAAPVA